MPRLKKFNLKLYEVELIALYDLLKSNKPHMIRVESEIKKILDNSKDFKIWNNTIKNIERKNKLK